MQGNFARAFERTVGHEGGFQMDPADPGNYVGKRLVGTKYGISARSYPDLNIPNLTLDHARAIYRRDYWDRVKGDDLPAGVDVFVFDYAVNSGVRRAAMALQRSVSVADDGVIGPVTLAAVKSRSPLDIVRRVAADRAQLYRALSTFDRFGRGWLRRNQDMLAYAIEIAQTEGVTL